MPRKSREVPSLARLPSRSLKNEKVQTPTGDTAPNKLAEVDKGSIDKEGYKRERLESSLQLIVGERENND